MTTDESMSVLTSEECYALLETGEFGRLGVIVDRYPVIIPVNYAMDENIVVIRSKPGTKLTGAQHANVTFQVDHVDQVNRSGWSVLVRGQAEEVTADHGKDIVDRTERTGVRPYAPGEDFRWVRIIPHGISGRRINSAEDQQWRLGTAAYM